MTSIRKGLLQFIFSGAYMKRWNDKLRPTELIEIDKQAHKMIVAWLLCQVSAVGMTQAERLALEEQVVQGGIFDYFFRLVVTDIKPPILYRIKDNPEHYQMLAKWAIAEVEPHVRPLGTEFWEKFQAHSLQPRSQGLAAEILNAAHLYASVWEFRLLKPFNTYADDELPYIERIFTEQLASYTHIPGMDILTSGLAPQQEGMWTSSSVRAFTANTPDEGIAPLGTEGQSNIPVPALARFANLCGQLRFQKRWSQTPRIPETSVMGHMFIVACYSYVLSMALEACPARRVNNFFCGLFHDLPELLTRDIISPVKKSFSGLSELIRQYEENELERRVLAPLRAGGHSAITTRLGYYLGLETDSEFDETIQANGKICKVDFTALHTLYNSNEHDPKDGEAIKICDTLAAYIEAYTAMRNGITSDQIQQAFWRMREQNAKRTLAGLHIGALFTDFD